MPAKDESRIVAGLGSVERHRNGRRPVTHSLEVARSGEGGTREALEA